MLKFNAIRFKNVEFWKKTLALRFENVSFFKKPTLYAFKTLNFKLTLPSLAALAQNCTVPTKVCFITFHSRVNFTSVFGNSRLLHVMWWDKALIRIRIGVVLALRVRIRGSNNFVNFFFFFLRPNNPR